MKLTLEFENGNERFRFESEDNFPGNRTWIPAMTEEILVSMLPRLRNVLTAAYGDIRTTTDDEQVKRRGIHIQSDQRNTPATP